MGISYIQMGQTTNTHMQLRNQQPSKGSQKTNKQAIKQTNKQKKTPNNQQRKKCKETQRQIFKTDKLEGQQQEKTDLHN